MRENDTKMFIFVNIKKNLLIVDKNKQYTNLINYRNEQYPPDWLIVYGNNIINKNVYNAEKLWVQQQRGINT